MKPDTHVGLSTSAMWRLFANKTALVKQVRVGWRRCSPTVSCVHGRACWECSKIYTVCRNYSSVANSLIAYLNKPNNHLDQWRDQRLLNCRTALSPSLSLPLRHPSLAIRGNKGTRPALLKGAPWLPVKRFPIQRKKFKRRLPRLSPPSQTERATWRLTSPH